MLALMLLCIVGKEIPWLLQLVFQAPSKFILTEEEVVVVMTMLVTKVLVLFYLFVPTIHALPFCSCISFNFVDGCTSLSMRFAFAISECCCGTWIQMSGQCSSCWHWISSRSVKSSSRNGNWWASINLHWTKISLSADIGSQSNCSYSLKWTFFASSLQMPLCNGCTWSILFDRVHVLTMEIGQ